MGIVAALSAGGNRPSPQGKVSQKPAKKSRKTQAAQGIQG
jgi:hypothetical protein